MPAPLRLDPVARRPHDADHGQLAVAIRDQASLEVGPDAASVRKADTGGDLVLGADSPLDQGCQLLRRRLDVGGVEELERRLAAQLMRLAAEDLGGRTRRVQEVSLEIVPDDRLGRVREQPREIGRARHFPFGIPGLLIGTGPSHQA